MECVRKTLILLLLAVSAASAADYGEIPFNLTMPAGTVVRRNVGDTAFETFIPTTGGTPGGSDTQVQFNDATSFGGDAGLTWDKTNKAVRITGPGSEFALGGINAQLGITSDAGASVGLSHNGHITFIEAAANGDLDILADVDDTGGELHWIAAESLWKLLFGGTEVVYLKIPPVADPPTPPAEGMTYADTDHHLYYYNGTTFAQLDNGAGVTGEALTKTDDTNVTLTLGGAASTALVNAASITAGWSGQLSVARGGTGAATFPAHSYFGNNTGSTAAPAPHVIDYSELSGTPTVPSDISGASFVTKVADGSLSNEFALGSLATGLLKNTTTTGVPTIAVAGTDYTDNAFKTISVSGQSDVIADSASDTLTLAAGSNITITTTAGTDTVTIASSAGGSVDDTAWASSWNGVTTTAPSKNAVYDWGHTHDTDDDGLVDVLDTAVGTTAGTTLTVTSTAPAQITTAQTGINATYRASDAIAGSATVGGAGGGNIFITAGDAKRLTSGNGAGGDVNISSGGGVGSLGAGDIQFRTASTAKWKMSGTTFVFGPAVNPTDLATSAIPIATGYFNNITLGGVALVVPSDTAFASSWNGVTTVAPSKNAVYDEIHLFDVADDGTILNAGTGFRIGGAAASGKILVGNGTNYVASTPTFPNASATNGKVIKSDGTNWVASTETYAAPGTSGNVLTSDGTNWLSSVPASGGAGTGLSYITKVSEATLSNEFALGSLATGLLKNTTTTGVPTVVAAPSGAVVGDTDTQTLTAKRISNRTGTTTSSATPTINTDNIDFYSLTAQAVDITSFTTNLSGTPVESDTLWIAITGTASRAITWGASFEPGSAALPTTTSGTTRLDVAFIWNTVTSKWRCMGTNNAFTIASTSNVLKGDGAGNAVAVGTATSRKILVGDGTNFIPSTETYAVPGTSGNVLTSDGTNWLSSAPVGGGASVANPGSQLLGLTAINGSAATALRSDGAMALDQSIAPTWTGVHTWTLTDGGTNSVSAPMIIGHNSTGTAVTSFGTEVLFKGESSTTNDTTMGEIATIWETATHGSRVAALRLTAYSFSGASTPVYIWPGGGISTNNFVNPGSAVIMASNGIKTNNTTAATGAFLIGNGTVYNASAYALPTTISTNGKVLQSNGTDFINSVPTWPASSGTSGYTVRSDGTNFASYPQDMLNSSVADDTSFSTSDRYITGSSVVVAAGDFKAKGQYHCVFDMVKSAGTGAIVISVKIGTAGSVIDTSRITFTFGAGTAVADTGTFDVWVTWRTVGSGTSAVVSGVCNARHNLATTGLFNNAPNWTIVGTTSSGFDSSGATTIGLSFNGSTAFAGTNKLVQATLVQ